MRHFLHPLAMVHCFSILLVKAMQLRSIAYVGLGGKISQVNQLVCLLFMLLVQVRNNYNILMLSNINSMKYIVNSFIFLFLFTIYRL